MARKQSPSTKHNTVVVVLTILLVAQGLYMFQNEIFSLFGAATAVSSVGITNAVPVGSAGSLNGGGAITLNAANQTTYISATATVTDNNGCDDVTNVNATLFLENMTDSLVIGDINNQSKYINSSCTKSGCTPGGSDTTATYSCGFSMVHYAEPTDAGSNYSQAKWNVTIYPWDSFGRGVHTSNAQEVNTQRSFDAGAAVNFTTLALGANTGATNYNITIYNTGNEQIDMSVDGYGNSDGDGVSMICDLANISLERLKYSNQSFTYNVFNNVSSGINMTDVAAQLELNLHKGDQADGLPNREIAFGMGVPASGVEGGCTGTVQLTAAADPTGD